MKDDSSSSQSSQSRLKKITHEKHVLLRAETYIGSTKKTKVSAFVADFVNDKVKFKAKQITTIPGLFSVIDEIIVNGLDHQRRSLQYAKDFPVKNLKIYVNDDGSIGVFNDGNGIPVEKQENEYVPTLCMGQLLTSENYDDNERRLVGGRNGFGSALTNIWSKQFCLETQWIHPETKKAYLFRQLWEDNMDVKYAPTIKIVKKKTGFTKVTFTPDYQRFGVSDSQLPRFVKIVKQVLCKRACDIAAISALNVYFQDKKMVLKNYVPNVKSYPPLYAYTALMGGTHMTYANLGARWQCVVAVMPDDPNCPPFPSFVNGVCAVEGGPFVDAVEKEFISQLRKYTKGKTKVDLRKADIKSRVCIVVNALVENPEFRTQTKHFCISKEFGSVPVWKESDLNRAVKNVFPVVEQIAQMKTKMKHKRLIGAIQGTKLSIPKYEGAKKAGSKKESIQCNLYLTEGDSAKAFVVTGFGVIGRTYNGVFPLKGKLINARKFGQKKVMENAEIQNLMKIIGLQPGVVPQRTKLRYGKIVIVTDQDVDGSHIKGLIMNFLHWGWPNVLKWEKFVTVFHTPLIVAKWRNNKKLFFTRGAFEQWKESTDVAGYTAKYYKGLATSSAKEAKEYFSNINNHLVPFSHEDTEEDIAKFINIGFSDEKEYKAQRKEMVYQKGAEMVDIVKNVPDFVTKELKAFWDDDNARSMPNAIDGFKESQRKIFFALRKKDTRSESKELRVAQVSAYTSEHTAYEHGEASLNEATIKMAQTYLGTNNINLLHPQGMFGTRLSSNDAGSPRYIHTFLTEIGDKIFPPANDVVLNYLSDGNISIEPEFYVGVIPFLLVNGSCGIGTGVSTSIWSFNPNDIVRITRQCMNDAEMDCIHPWVRNFKGTVKKKNESDYLVSGVVQKRTDTHVTITELYPGKTTGKYMEQLAKFKFVNTVETEGTEKNVHLEVKGEFPENDNDALLHKLSLTKTYQMNKMNAFGIENDKTVLKGFTVHDIVRLHKKCAFEIYEKRRLYEIEMLEKDIYKKREKAYFIQGWVDGVLKAGEGSKEKVVEWMISGNFSSEDNFKHLRRLPNEQLFRKKIEELKTMTEEVEGKLHAMQSVTWKDMWVRDLNEFDKYYNEVFLKCDD